MTLTFDPLDEREVRAARRLLDALAAVPVEEGKPAPSRRGPVPVRPPASPPSETAAKKAEAALLRAGFRLE